MSRYRRRIMVSAGVLASLAILAYLIGSHFGEVLRIAGSLDRRYLAAAVGCSIASYAMMGLALREVLGLLGYSRPFFEVLGITYVSATANYLVSTAGVSGFALKAHLLRKRNIPYGATVIASAVTSALMYFVLGIIVFQGALYLFLQFHGTRITVLEGALGLAVLALTSVPFLAVLLIRDVPGRLTRRLFRWVDRVAFVFSKQEIPRENFEEFEAQLNQGLRLIHGNRGRLTRAIAYICLDWCFAMGVLYCGFRAVGSSLSVGHLSSVFAVGQAMTVIPFLPGGMGAMEGAMTAMMQGLGLGWDEALVAVLVYRLAYFILPSISSIFILWGLKVSEPRWVEETVFETLPEALCRRAEHRQRRPEREEVSRC